MIRIEYSFDKWVESTTTFIGIVKSANNNHFRLTGVNHNSCFTSIRQLKLSPWLTVSVSIESANFKMHKIFYLSRALVKGGSGEGRRLSSRDLFKCCSITHSLSLHFIRFVSLIGSISSRRRRRRRIKFALKKVSRKQESKLLASATLNERERISSSKLLIGIASKRQVFSSVSVASSVVCSKISQIWISITAPSLPT